MHVAHGWSRSQTSPLKGRTYCIQTENSKHNKRDNLMIEWVFSDWHGLCFKWKKLDSHLVTKKTSFDYQVVSSVLLPISCVECSVSAPYVPWTRSCPFKISILKERSSRTKINHHKSTQNGCKDAPAFSQISNMEIKFKKEKLNYH